MTLRHIRTFVTVYQEGSIVAAAGKLHISQPAVSLTIRELEEHYGFKLFERISRKLFITPEGKEIYNQAFQIITLFEEMDLTSESLKQRYMIRIGCGMTMGELLMPKIVSKFLAINNDVTIKVLVESYLTIMQKILNNELDFGLIDSNIHDSHNLEHSVFQETPLVVVCNKKNSLAQKKSLTLNDIADQNFITLVQSTDSRVAVENIFLANNLKINVVWETLSLISIVNAVVAGLGIAVLPLRYVNNLQNNDIGILNVKGFNIKRKINLIYRKKKHLSEASLRFIEFCKDQMK